MQFGISIRNQTTKHKWPAIVQRKLLVLSCLLTILPMVFGQGVSGRILGAVQDKSGAALVKATVTVTDQGTEIDTTVNTDSNGQYSVANLQPGNYQVRFEASGFRPFISVGNVVIVDASTRVDATLQVGTQQE